MNMLLKNSLAKFAATVLSLVAIGAASGQTIAPSTFSTSIQVQEEAEGTEFDDWASIPVAFSDPVDNPGDFEGRPFTDLAEIQVANDSEFLYLRVGYHNTSSINTFVTFDTDQDLTTGFDIFDLGIIGTEVGYQNDFVFQQTTGVFNVGVALTGGPLGNGGALLYPFWDQDGIEKEYAIPLDLALGFPLGDPAFANATFDFMVFHEDGAGDILDEVITYTLATAPELQGDYNEDGTVDAADYTVWRDSENSIGVDLAADGNGDEVVDGADYTIWASNYGTSNSVSTAATVPEPSSFCLLASTLSCFFIAKRS